MHKQTRIYQTSIMAYSGDIVTANIVYAFLSDNKRLIVGPFRENMQPPTQYYTSSPTKVIHTKDNNRALKLCVPRK